MHHGDSARLLVSPAYGDDGVRGGERVVANGNVRRRGVDEGFRSNAIVRRRQRVRLLVAVAITRSEVAKTQKRSPEG
jgi:hypothetical protein